jgi:hypothetical protein
MTEISRMTFDQALKKLNIEDYKERIFNSNSHGELFHIQDYIFMAENILPENEKYFRFYFEKIVKWAEETWNRPESIYQHMLKQFQQ